MNSWFCRSLINFDICTKVFLQCPDLRLYCLQQVLSSEFLIAPVMKQAQEKALIGAKVKAKEEVMARLMVEKEALQSQKGDIIYMYIYI